MMKKVNNTNSPSPQEEVRPSDCWNRLRNTDRGDGEDGVASLASTVHTGFGLVRFALGLNGEPRLLIPCGQGTLLATGSPENLSIRVANFTGGGGSSQYIDLCCRLRPLDGAFAELCTEILHRLNSGEAPAASVEGTIADFKSLLAIQLDGDITQAEIIGLVGELIILSYLIQFSPSAVETWTGPIGQRHDFRRTTHALEVKTSSRKDARLVSVTSIEQLTPPMPGTLALAHVRIERAADGTQSVLRLVRRILSNGASPKALQDRLGRIGCSDPSSPQWNRISFELEGVDVYGVEEGFPRISASHFPQGVVPPGIRDITYTIDLSAAATFLLSPDDSDDTLRRIAI